MSFFLGLFALPVGSKILDVGCGTGRHAVELARRGYRVTGVDFSEAMLSIARPKSDAVRWVNADAREFDLGEHDFDAAICLCEGAVGLTEAGEDAEEHDRRIFANIARHLRPNAPFLLTALNGYQTIRQMNDQFVLEGRFDPATMRSNYQDEMDLPEGPKIVDIHERLFIPPEMARLLREGGFRVEHIWGGTAGHWAQRPLSLDEIEAMYVCRKAQVT